MRITRAVMKKIIPWLFLTPVIIFIILSWVAPVALTLYLGFTDLSIKNFLAFIRDFFTPEVHITLENFEKIFFGGDPYLPEVLKITIIYVVSVLAINAFYSLILSISIAYFLKHDYLSLFLRVSWLLPRITPGVIYALMWNWFIDPRYGMLNTLLSLAGIPKEMLPQSWLLDKPYSQILMIMVNGYIGASFGMIVYTAAIKSIPPDLINAALVDGANEFQVARHIIIPLLKWPIFFVVAWQTLSLLASYEQILLIWGAGGGGGYAGIARAAGVMVWALYSYSKAFSEYQYGYASAISVVLVVVGIALILIYFKLFGFSRLMAPSKVEV
ncbi:MAG: sugar ABC transporter permease [Desulfurococcales archaeon]|nr:sugar ABC transporter permease [Desulfurococcales archaeon]